MEGQPEKQREGWHKSVNAPANKGQGKDNLGVWVRHAPSKTNHAPTYRLPNPLRGEKAKNLKELVDQREYTRQVGKQGKGHASKVAAKKREEMLKELYKNINKNE